MKKWKDLINGLSKIATESKTGKLIAVFQEKEYNYIIRGHIGHAAVSLLYKSVIYLIFASGPA